MFKFLERRAFKKEFKRAASDGILSNQERQSLSNLNVDQAFADKVRHDHFLKVTKDIRDRILKTRRMSPEDELQIFKIAGDLAIVPDLGSQFRMARELWAVDHGEEVCIEEQPTTLMLRNGEKGCFSANSSWMQRKTISQRVGYSGFSTRIRIAKGLSYNIGTVRPRYETSEQMKQLAVGNLVITTKRLVFDGDGRSTNITFNRMLSAELFENGIEICKTSGNDDFFGLPPLEAEYACLVIHQLNNNS